MFFFSDFFSCLSIESCSFAFSLCLTFIASMNLGKTVARCGVERVFLCESIPVQTHVLSAFGGRAACDLDKNHIFPWGVLATITLVGGWS